jgi:hypothetical protein
MFTPKFQRHYVLEVNAFGDLLPDVVHDGEDVYMAELILARLDFLQVVDRMIK